MSETLKCSIPQCKRRCTEVESMNLTELEKTISQCEQCGAWILKESDIANKTYHKVSNHWAAKFNEDLFGK